MCLVLQSSDPLTPPKTKSILLQLALRFFKTLPAAFSQYSNPDKMCLLLEILMSFDVEDETGKKMWNEAYEALSSEDGKKMSDSSLVVDERRRIVWAKLGKWTEEKELSIERLDRG